jgi:hypothetical protein
LFNAAACRCCHHSLPKTFKSSLIDWLEPSNIAFQIQPKNFWKEKFTPTFVYGPTKYRLFF